MSLQEIGVEKCKITMKDGYIQDCFAVQTDSARVLDFQVVEDGNYADLSGVDILLYVAEGDKAVYSKGDIIDAQNGRFRVNLFNQQLLRPGKHKAQIEMTSGGKSISSPIFYIDVEKSIKSGAEAGVNIALDFQEMKKIKSVVEQIELNIEKEHSDIKNTVQRGKDTAVHLSEIIKTSGTSQSKLVELIRSAGTTEEDIKKVVSEANLAKERLDGSRKKSAETVVKLENLNESGASTNLTLKNSIKDATSTKKALEELGVAIKKDVEVNKQDFDEKKSDFDSKYQGVLDIVSAEQARVEAEKLRATHDKKLQKLFEKGIEAELGNYATKEYVDKVNKKTVDDFNNNFSSIKDRLGIVDSNVLGLQVDYENKAFKRLGQAVGLVGGNDFDRFSMYGGRKKCNVFDDGTIAAYYGDENYKEDGSNGQVMVYQPKFYYKVVPLKLEPIQEGRGFHIRKANYYISDSPVDGFKLHPAFYDKNGNEIDYILMSAYEGCIYDTSANTYLVDDEQVMDASNDKFSSIAGARPASGTSQNLTGSNIEQMAKNRGEGWHSLGIKATSMEQLLMIVEMGMMDLQAAIGQSVVGLPWVTSPSKTRPYAGVTGSTASLGNGTGRATKTTTYEDGKAADYTEDGKTSICYRGVENFWGNLWKFVYGINFYRTVDKTLEGYICTDFNFAENKNSGNYENIGFTLSSANGYVSALGYSTKYDWVFFPSEVKGNSLLPVGDHYFQSITVKECKIPRLGGDWSDGSKAGGFYWALSHGVSDHHRCIGGRLVYVPLSK